MDFKDFKNILPRLFAPDESLQLFGSGGHRALPQEFGVLVWNIYKARKREWERDFHALAENKELILLQEAVFRTRFDSLFDIPERMEWVMARSHASRKTLCETGVKTGCVASSHSRAFFVSPDAEPLLKTPKMLLVTLYPLEGSAHPLMVVNVHAINFVSMEKYMRQIVQMAEAVEHHEGPVLLAGDFNTWNKTRYRELVQIAHRLNLTELVATRKGRIEHLYRHLDYIFYRGLEPLEGAFVRVRSSDHDPIVARFRVRT